MTYGDLKEHQGKRQAKEFHEPNALARALGYARNDEVCACADQRTVSAEAGAERETPP